MLGVGRSGDGGLQRVLTCDPDNSGNAGVVYPLRPLRSSQCELVRAHSVRWRLVDLCERFPATRSWDNESDHHAELFVASGNLSTDG